MSNANNIQKLSESFYKLAINTDAKNYYEQISKKLDNLKNTAGDKPITYFASCDGIILAGDNIECLYIGFDSKFPPEKKYEKTKQLLGLLKYPINEFYFIDVDGLAPNQTSSGLSPKYPQRIAIVSKKFVKGYVVKYLLNTYKNRIIK